MRTADVRPGLEGDPGTWHSDNAMQGCFTCDELQVEFLLALADVKAARQAVAFSATLAQLHSATDRLAYLDQSKEDARKQLVGHTARHHSRARHPEHASTSNAA